MMKKNVFIGFVFLTISTIVFASHEPYKRDFTVHFDTGNTYDVSIREDVLTWKGVVGEDKNIVQTVKAKRVSLTNEVDVFQWKEPRGYFVTFIVDLKHKKGLTSTKAKGNQDWLVAGDITHVK